MIAITIRTRSSSISVKPSAFCVISDTHRRAASLA
jgi:hypothetical protein